MLKLIISCALAISACQAAWATTAPDKPAASSLSGTHWELVAIQSMDDAQGTTRMMNPDHFTVSFAADGRASFRLDCNRGTSSWETKPSADGISGTLQFGPIATTRAICPPPHLDERVVRDLGYVRGYLLRHGKLFMSLMADGGIYEWRPQGGAKPAMAGQVLGTPIHTQDIEELRYAILRALTDRYAREQGISVSEAEIDAYLRDLRATLKINPATESSEDRAARQQSAAAFILQWKINQTLHRQYGGRIIYQQGGAEPFDAYRKFLDECNARSDFTISDPALEDAFWRYYLNETPHSFYKPGSREEAQVFAAPPWQRRHY